MSIQKKSLISTLKTAKKANVASSSHEVDAKGAKVASMRQGHLKTHNMRQTSLKQMSLKQTSLRQMKGINQKSLRKA